MGVEHSGFLAEPQESGSAEHAQSLQAGATRGGAHHVRGAVTTMSTLSCRINRAGTLGVWQAWVRLAC